jgi:hypothetical protein
VTHDVRGETEEMRTILPARFVLIGQSEVGLMDKGGSL